MAAPYFFADTSFAEDTSESRGIYFGVFGGGGSSMGSSIQQVGTVITPSNRTSDIPVNANGFNRNTGASIAGIRAGYEWSGWSLMSPGWSLRPATEIRAYILIALLMVS